MVVVVVGDGLQGGDRSTNQLVGEEGKDEWDLYAGFFESLGVFRDRNKADYIHDLICCSVL